MTRERAGIGVDGLFSTPADAAEVSDLKRKLALGISPPPSRAAAHVPARSDATGCVTWTDKESAQFSNYAKSPDVVADLFKLYLDALPEPVFTFDAYDGFLLASELVDRAALLLYLRHLLASLPPAYRSMAKQVVGLLSRFALASGEQAASHARQLAEVRLRPAAASCADRGAGRRAGVRARRAQARGAAAVHGGRRDQEERRAVLHDREL